MALESQVATGALGNIQVVIEPREIRFHMSRLFAGNSEVNRCRSTVVPAPGSRTAAVKPIRRRPGCHCRDSWSRYLRLVRCCSLVVACTQIGRSCICNA